ncbi:aminoglycoside N(3)-acetyltransferase [Aeromicrobium marinum]|uniref:aminoglycoside N(3)-acetyltransferase n=1 Tax=Aeromicrobium marinum TaxID=219314 RepID=UPI00058FB566|nr:AAC(3) family N-acetyltransferase [Aeromicrobium marinum]
MLERADVAQQLRDVGLRPGDLVFLHVSLRAVGPVDGGADGLIDALQDVVGPAGGLVMVLGSPEGVAFDPATTPVDPEMGVLAEVFRTRPDVRVGRHPASRLAAWGAAVPPLHPEPWHDYYGPGSPLQRFTEAGVRVLRLGADADTVTLTHWAEYVVDLPEKARVARTYVLAGGSEHLISSLDDSDGIAQWADGDYFAQVLLDFVAAGRARAGRVGGARAELLDGPEFVDFAVDWMRRHLGSGPGV